MSVDAVMPNAANATVTRVTMRGLGGGGAITRGPKGDVGSNTGERNPAATRGGSAETQTRPR